MGSLTRQTLRLSVARLVRDTRGQIGWTQRELGRRAGLSRAMVAGVEAARVDPSLRRLADLCDALGVQVALSFQVPFLADRRRQRDPAHARCVASVQRRLRAAGWLSAREVEIVHGRSHGWIDLLAYDRPTGRLLVIEVKTEIDDLGRIERTVGWYERASWATARRLGWSPRAVGAWLVVLATSTNEERLRENRASLASAFPIRADVMLEVIRAGRPVEGRGIALLDPSSRRRDWLMRSRIDGRRAEAPYRDYADFLATTRPRR